MTRVGFAASPVHVLALGAVLVAAWQSVASPGLVLAGVAALLFLALSTWNLLAGVAVFTVVTFPATLPAAAGVITIAKPAGFVLAFSWLLVVLRDRDEVPFLPRDRPALAFLTGAFLVWAGASVLWAEDADAARADVTRLVQVVVLFVIAYSAIRTSRDLRVLAWAFMTGAFVTAVYSIATGSYTETGRLAGIFDPNFFAVQLVASTAIASFMIGATRRASVRTLLVALILTYSTAFALTQSRGGMVGLAAALLASILYAGRHRRHAVVAACMVVAVAVGYFGFVAALDVRERITDFSSQASSGRADEWRIAFEMVRDEPLLGVGLGNYTVVEPAYAARNIDILQPQYVVHNRLEAHSTYLQVVSELGVIGLALFIALVLAAVAAAVRAIQLFELFDDAPGEALVRGVVVATVGLLVGYAFLSALFEKPLWLLLGILVATRVVADRQERTPPAPSHAVRLVPVGPYDDVVPLRA